MSINDLPIVLIKYLSLFMERDFPSFASFCLTCKKYKNLFPHIPQIYSIIHHSYCYKIEEKRDVKFMISIKSYRDSVIQKVLQRSEKLAPEALKYMIEKKADLNEVKYRPDETPLGIVCRKNSISPEILKMMIDQKADLNLEGSKKKKKF